MAIGKTRTRKHVIADMSLHHLAYLVVSCTFTVEVIHADYGYDISICTFDPHGGYENGNAFVQLKATDKIRADAITNEIKFRISRRDVLTWESELFPVYLVVFDATTARAYAVYLQRYFTRTGLSSAEMTSNSVEIRLPAEVIDEATIRGWRDHKNAVLAQIGSAKHG